MKRVLIIALIIMISGCGVSIDTNAAGEIMGNLYKFRQSGDIESEMSLYSSKLSTEGKLKLKKILSEIRSEEGKLISVARTKTKYKTHNGDKYLIITYKTKYENSEFLEQYTFSDNDGKPDLVNAHFQE